MAVEFEVSEWFAVEPKDLYDMWLDSQGHSRLTGAPARVSDKVGGSFEAWDGYIWGRNLKLEPPKRILQAWRTSEFSELDPDSRLEVRLETEEGGTRLTLYHSRLPADGMKYEQGWIDHYFEPMEQYLSSRTSGQEGAR